MKRRGILFSGTKENVSLALSHIHKHGIIYWCLPVNLKYYEFYFPVIALLHVKGDIVRYKCIINDIMPYSSCHFSDPKKKPITWIKGQKVEKRKYNDLFPIFWTLPM